MHGSQWADKGSDMQQLYLADVKADGYSQGADLGAGEAGTQAPQATVGWGGQAIEQTNFRVPWFGRNRSKGAGAHQRQPRQAPRDFGKSPGECGPRIG